MKNAVRRWDRMLMNRSLMAAAVCALVAVPVVATAQESVVEEETTIDESGAEYSSTALALAVMNLRWKGDNKDAWKELGTFTKTLNPIILETLRRDSAPGSILSEEDIDKVLSPDARKRMRACDDGQACVAEVGAAIGADLMITGLLSKRGDSYKLSLNLISTRELAVIRSLSERISYGQDAVKEAARQAVRQLLDPESPTRQAVLTVKSKGTVKVDGKEVGEGPGSFRVPAGERRISVATGTKSVLNQKHQLFPYLVSTVSSGGVTATGFERFEAEQDALRPWYKEWWVWTAGALVIGGVIASRVAAGSGDAEP